MAIKWKVFELERKASEGSLSDVCTEAHWVVIDEDNGGSYRFGETTFNAPDSDSFIAFDSLTYDTVLNWVKTLLGTSEVNSIESGLTTKTTNQKDGTVIPGVPW
tara:strand:- start:74 stop:385 length:312 start_codon:yes stop_codon:yes gene_type:complete